MKKDFVTYEIALELKKQGFDEPCLGIHYNEGLNPSFMVASQYGEHGATANGGILAPLYQQAFRFFRENYELYYTIEGSKKEGFQYFIYTYEYEIKSEESFNSYEETEQECLKKLIEILKNK
jgi:hypothetical protein